MSPHRARRRRRRRRVRPVERSRPCPWTCSACGRPARCRWRRRPGFLLAAGEPRCAWCAGAAW